MLTSIDCLDAVGESTRIGAQTFYVLLSLRAKFGGPDLLVAKLREVI